MKTLQESLFDKDLTTKEITLRHAYTPTDNNPIKSWGANIMMMFDASKISKYPNPYEYEYKYPEGLQCLSGIIMDMPVPSKSDIKQGNKSKWCKDLKEKFDKYIRREWKQQWDDSVEVWLAEKSHVLIIEIDLDKFMGIIQWNLNPIK